MDESAIHLMHLVAPRMKLAAQLVRPRSCLLSYPSQGARSYTHLRCFEKLLHSCIKWRRLAVRAEKQVQKAACPSVVVYQAQPSVKASSAFS